MNKGIYETGSYWVEQSTFFLTDSEWKAKHLVSLINSIPKSLLPQNRINIVEVGCGAGGVLYYFLRMMEQKGFYCHGVGYDISPVAIQKARELFAGIKYQVADITDIKKSDLLLISDVLEHVEGPSQFIRQCFDISPLVIIHLPLDYNYWGMLLRGKKYFEYLEKDRGHIHYFNKKSAFKLVNSAGAKVI
ncbi:MAG: class I SAM-dependent methyltransferase, partial [Thermodesulfobacteriota bacterium]